MSNLNTYKLNIICGFQSLAELLPKPELAQEVFMRAYYGSMTLEKTEERGLIKVISLYGLILVAMANNNAKEVAKRLDEIRNFSLQDFADIFDMLSHHLKNGWNLDVVSNLAKKALTDYY